MRQSSCFGSFLFLIFINDLPLILQGRDVTMYADNISPCYLREAINNDLKRLHI